MREEVLTVLERPGARPYVTGTEINARYEAYRRLYVGCTVISVVGVDKTVRDGCEH